ncbi:MAG TPA: cyclase family protein [Trueperaceae bacterium]|nr:cyclase family protein [Trueperaceae bacterium]
MIDITRELAEGHPVWPGDSRYDLQQVSSIDQGSAVNVMRLTTTTHLGTHVDAPWHYAASGGRLVSVGLDVLVGEALVVDARGEGGVPETVLPDTPLPPRVLLYTGQAERWDRFPSFRPLTPGLIAALAGRGVRLVGTDAPSVDPIDSKDLPAHRACFRASLAIVEGLELTRVAAGRYRLICLPLRMPHADASPVRAVLEPL